VRELLVEILLRLVKPMLAGLTGLIVWAVAVGALRAQPSVELLLLSWIAGAAFVLLVQEGPV